MLASQLADRREPRGRLGSSQELAGQNLDEIVDGSYAMSFANLKHNQMIPTGPPAVQPSSATPRLCETTVQRLDWPR